MSIQQGKFKQIADKIREKLGTQDLIKPSDFVNKIDDVYKAGGLACSPQETVSGEIVAVDDVSPIEHDVDVKVASKNLLNITAVSQEINGITVTVNDDKSITVNGTATTTTYITIGEQVFEPNTYYFSGCTGGNYSTYILFWQMISGENMSPNLNGATAFTLTKKERRRILIAVYKGATVENVTFYPMITTYNTTDYTPYVPDVSTATVKTQGKNLFNNDTSLIEQIDFFASDGTTPYTRVGYKIPLPIGTYTIRAIPKTSEVFDYYVYGGVMNENNVKHSNVSPVAGSTLRTITFDINKGDVLLIYEGGTSSISNIGFVKQVFNYFNIQLEVGETATDYEPYIEPISYSVAEDGVVEGVKSIYPNMTITTDTQGVVVDCTYKQDGQKVKENLTDLIISLGGEL